jgi:serine/threonine protein kinase
MLDLRKNGKPFPEKALKRIGISLLHLHEHGIIHSDFGTHNIGKFGSRWKLLGVGGSVPLGRPTDPNRGFYHPPEAIVVENKRGAPMGKKNYSASVISIPAQATYDIWAFGVVLYEALAGLPLGPYACRGKRAMSASEVCKIGLWDEANLKKALKHVPDDDLARDLLKRLLHPNPEKRIASMRHVLEHGFFTRGSHNDGFGGQTSPTNNAFDSSDFDPRAPGPGSNNPGGNQRFTPSQQFQQQFSNTGFDTGDIKWSESVESVENHQNGVRNSESSEGGGRRSSTESAKSGRSFGGGFRKLARNTFRGSNNTRQSNAAF